MTIRRILSIDGGGIKGIFPVAFLASLEQEVESPIGDYFDLIAGTSTGGIIALGLGLGFTAKELLRFYEELGGQVFAGNRLLRSLRRIGFAKYSQKPLRKALESKFGNSRIGESKIRLIIPSLNLDTGKVHVFKTAHHPHFQKDYKESVVDTALATAAAPTYFPTHRAASGVPLVDGGVWANNPAGVSVVEAIGVLGWKGADLRVLSIGCTESPLDVNLGRYYGLGVLYWADKIAEVLGSAQSSASLGTARLLVGKENVYRVSPYAPEKRFGLDIVKEISSLRGLGSTEAREALPTLKPVFFERSAERFVPCHF